jgi:gluconate kinase
MHYNPASIARATGEVQRLGEQNELACVLVESCQTRWDKSEKFFEQLDEWQKPLYRSVLANEMKAAAEVAKNFNRPIVLGDQKIEDTDARLKTSVGDTLKDLINPFGGGWQSIASDIQRGVKSFYGPPMRPKVFVVFGRPGSGKSTIANKMLSMLAGTTPNAVFGLELDDCVPQWMRGNFAKGIYPSLNERQQFAAEAIRFVQSSIDANADAKACIVSFSFVNTDLRDAFRAHYPDSKWILVDTTPEDAQARISSREGHFYKGAPKDESPSATRGDASDWQFAPVTFPHLLLNGRVSVEENTAQCLSLLESTGSGYLSASDFFEPEIVSNIPVSLFRYPSAITLRFPKFAAGIALGLSSLVWAEGSLGSALLSVDGGANMNGLVLPGSFLDALFGPEDSPASWIASILLFTLETAVLGRGMLIPVLVERNAVLAQSIVDSCATVPTAEGASSGGAVVAVLGMAHCNGVRKLIETGQVRASAGSAPVVLLPVL